MRRIVRFVLNFVFALVPVAVSVLIRTANNAPIPDGIYAPEILFLAIMVSATTVNDISSEVAQLGGDMFFEIIRTFLIVGIIAAAGLYGGYLQDSLSNPGNLVFRAQVMGFAIGLAVVFSLISLLSVIFLARIERASVKIGKQRHQNR